MVSLLSFKLLYFILALIFGFVLGYIFLQKQSENKVLKTIKDLEDDIIKTRQDQDDINSQFFDIKNKLQISKDLLSTQYQNQEKLKENTKEFEKKIITFQEAKETTQNKITNTLEDIEVLKKDIEKIKKEFLGIDDVVREHESLNHEKQYLSMEIETLENNINTFIKNKNKLRENLSQNQKFLQLLEQDISDLSNKKKRLEKYKELQRTANFEDIDKEIEKNKTKMLNYKYKVEEIEDKLSKGYKVDKDEIKNFIAKNEDERFIDKFIGKLFHKGLKS